MMQSKLLLNERWIFVVEDDIQNRVVFQMALIRHGAKVEFERWGDDTLRTIQFLPRVDLIILDLMLAHNISGFDVYDQIRSVEAFATVPIVAVSAMDPALALPRAQAKGLSGFIAKPINPVLFPQQIAQIIAGETIWYAGGV